MLRDPPLRSSVRYTDGLRYGAQWLVLLKMRLEQTKTIKGELPHARRDSTELIHKVLLCGGECSDLEGSYGLLARRYPSTLLQSEDVLEVQIAIRETILVLSKPRSTSGVR